MKTPMPEPVTWAITGYSESQLRAAMVAAYNEGVEEAALAAAKHGEECEWATIVTVEKAIRKLEKKTP